MTPEGVDVAEECIVDACARTTIVHQLQDIISAVPHLIEPRLRNTA